MTAHNKQELRELREAFQSWWKTQRSVCQFSRVHSYDGPYRSKAVQSAWEVWQVAHGSKLEAAEKRIAELESFISQSCYVFDGRDADISDSYIDASTSSLMPKVSTKNEGEPCRHCSDGSYSGLPGGACEHCMGTGLDNPAAGIGAKGE